MRVIYIHTISHRILLAVALFSIAYGLVGDYPWQYIISSTGVFLLSTLFLQFGKLFRTDRLKNYIFQVFSYAVVLSVHFPVFNYFLNYGNNNYKDITYGVLPDIFIQASLFILLFSLSFCIGLHKINFRYFTQTSRLRSLISGSFLKPIAIDKSIIFSLIILFGELFLLFLDIALGASNPENTAEVGFVTRFIPRDIFFLSGLFLAINLSERYVISKRIVYLYIVIYLLKSILSGVRGAFILVFLLSYFVLIFSRPYLKVKTKHLVYLSLLLLLLPLYLSVSSRFKSEIHSQATNEDAIETEIKSSDSQDISSWIFGRFQGYIYLVKSMSDNTAEIESYVNLSNIVQSTLGSILPDRIFQSDVPSIGKLASVYYNGLDWEHKNAGAMFIFSLVWIWMGWLGVLFPILLLLIIKWLVKWIYTEPSYTKTISVLYIIWVLLLSFTISGNIDVLTASLVTNMVGFYFIVTVLRIRTV